MKNIEFDSILGLFENIFENDEKSSDLKSQIKAINADSSDQFKEFAKEVETKPKILKSAYKYWRDKKKDGSDETDEDYFTILSLIDTHFENENENENEEEDNNI